MDICLYCQQEIDELFYHPGFGGYLCSCCETEWQYNEYNIQNCALLRCPFCTLIFGGSSDDRTETGSSVDSDSVTTVEEYINYDSDTTVVVTNRYSTVDEDTDIDF